MWIKICGLCDTESARNALEIGVDAIGLNFVRRSKRYVSVERARDVADIVRGKVEIVGVVEDLSLEEINELRNGLGLDRIQIHGNAVGLDITRWPTWAYRAVGLAVAEDVHQLDHGSGDRVLVDTSIGGKSGGTGAVFDWTWVIDAAKHCRLVLAGGLSPANVQGAIQVVQPFGVDVAGGVERLGEPRSKDPELMRLFVQRARDAANAS